MEKYTARELVEHFDSRLSCPFCKTNCAKHNPASMIYERRGDDETFSSETCIAQQPPSRGPNNPWDRSIGITYNDVFAIAHILSTRNPTISPELFFEGRHDLPYLVNLFGRNGGPTCTPPAITPVANPTPAPPVPSPVMPPVPAPLAPAVESPLAEPLATVEYSSAAHALLSGINFRCPRCDGTCIGKHPDHLLYNKGAQYTIAACAPITDSSWMPLFLQDKRVPHPNPGSSALVNAITLEAIANVLTIRGTDLTPQDFGNRANLLRTVNDLHLMEALSDMEESIRTAYGTSCRTP